ncbi:DNA polymerase III subunit beta [Nonomuraea basaltis]|uniref:DNA polymerase III subunit beta n=1 Tax=Nonomuraea basaltis TaxID=2495887 RepID=UPI001F0F50F5|nr:DNA polymerase III subunit beta [Nonomuraea basaltis]
MKLTIPTKTLAETITWAARAIPKRPAVPVLTGLLLGADDNKLTVSAFDYEQSATATITAQVAEPGTILVPGRLLAEIVAKLPGKDVELAASDADVTLTCDKAEFTLLLMPAADYPALPETPPAIGAVEAAVFKAAVAQVAPSASKDDTLPMLQAARLDLDGDTMTTAATDRYRIAMRQFTWQPAEVSINAGVNAPARELLGVLKTFPACLLTLGRDPAKGVLAISNDERTVTLRLLDDQFIDYRARVKADDYTTWATLTIKPLVAAIKRVALVAYRSGPVHLAFTAMGVMVSAGDGDTGKASEFVDAKLEGDDISIAFQPNYLLDGLNTIATPTARMGMTKPAKPALLLDTVGDGEESTFRYLVMALRTLS